jgi:hypothetical protein
MVKKIKRSGWKEGPSTGARVNVRKKFWGKGQQEGKRIIKNFPRKLPVNACIQQEARQCQSNKSMNPSNHQQQNWTLK